MNLTYKGKVYKVQDARTFSANDIKVEKSNYMFSIGLPDEHDSLSDYFDSNSVDFKKESGSITYTAVKHTRFKHGKGIAGGIRTFENMFDIKVPANVVSALKAWAGTSANDSAIVDVDSVDKQINALIKETLNDLKDYSNTIISDYIQASGVKTEKGAKLTEAMNKVKINSLVEYALKGYISYKDFEDSLEFDAKESNAVKQGYNKLKAELTRMLSKELESYKRKMSDSSIRDAEITQDIAKKFIEAYKKETALENKAIKLCNHIVSEIRKNIDKSFKNVPLRTHKDTIYDVDALKRIETAVKGSSLESEYKELDNLVQEHKKQFDLYENLNSEYNIRKEVFKNQNYFLLNYKGIKELFDKYFEEKNSLKAGDSAINVVTYKGKTYRIGDAENLANGLKEMARMFKTQDKYYAYTSLEAFSKGLQRIMNDLK